MAYSKKLDDLGITRTGANDALIEACRLGEPLKLGQDVPEEGGNENTIHAALIRHLLQGGCEDAPLGEKGVRIYGAWIMGALDLVLVDSAAVLLLHDSNVSDGADLNDAKLGMVSFIGSRLSSLRGQRMKLGGSFYLRGITAIGSVDLSGSIVGGELSCVGATFEKGLFGYNLDITGGCYLRNGFTANGAVDLAGSTIGGAFDCAGATFEKGLKGHRLNITGSCFLRNGFTAKGAVHLNGSTIGGQLDCEGATFEQGLKGHGLDIAGSCFLRNGFTAKGAVDLSGSIIGRQLACDGATFEKGLGLAGVKIGAELFLQPSKAPPKISLRDAKCQAFTDKGLKWDDVTTYDLTGFTYDRFGIVDLDRAKRIEWAANSVDWGRPDRLSPMPYTQLAMVYARAGQRREASQVLLAREQQLTRQASDSAYKAAGRGWSPRAGFASVTLAISQKLYALFGYGFNVTRPVLISLTMIGFAWVWFHLAWNAGDMVPTSDVVLNSTAWGWALVQGNDNPAAYWAARHIGSDYETFSSFWYAFDLFLPLDALGLEESWSPSKDRGLFGQVGYYLRFLLQLWGWLFTAFGAAYFTGFVGRRAEQD